MLTTSCYSVTYLERLLELAWLDVTINFPKKSCYLRTASRSSNGRKLAWIAEWRYVGVHFVKSMTLKCSLDAATDADSLRVILRSHT